MNRTRIAIVAAAALTSSLFAFSASAQNYAPPPGNVNPGSMNSGAEDSGSEDQPRSNEGYGTRGGYYGGAYAAPYGSTGRDVPALGYGPSDRSQPQGAPPFGGGYDD
jgi:hypothetical protein